jgi:hypothetical protein
VERLGTRTIDALFDIVERVLKLGPEVARIEGTYDPLYGFPVYLKAVKIELTDNGAGFEITYFSRRK